jgi:hypothetical protein
VVCCLQVHAWEPDPRHLPQLQQALQRQARKHSISVHDTAAWTSGGTVPFYPFAIRGQRAGQGTHLAWWQRLGQLVSAGRQGEPSGSMFPLLTQPQPGASDVDSSSAGSSNNTEAAVAAADFGAWLLQNARPQDYVCVHMDIAGAATGRLLSAPYWPHPLCSSRGTASVLHQSHACMPGNRAFLTVPANVVAAPAGAEFDVLPALIRDGSIGLIDELRVMWSTALRWATHCGPAGQSLVCLPRLPAKAARSFCQLCRCCHLVASDSVLMPCHWYLPLLQARAHELA